MRSVAPPFLTCLMVVGSGCLIADPPAAIGCKLPDLHVVTGPLSEQGTITREKGGDISSLVWLRNRANLTLQVVLPDKPIQLDAPDDLDAFDVTAIAGTMVLEPNETLFARVEYPGRFYGEYPPFELRASLVAPSGGPTSCVNRATASARYTYVGEFLGETARPGVGALVRTAGFWTNGTLFYTNIDRVHNDTGLARAGWYDYEGGDPLKVYVYNSTRAELPPRYNRSGYGTTIPGFNNALKGMSVAGSKVAELRPEDAYTRPGNDKHRLYGDALVFYIEVDEVVAVNCKLPAPFCEVPTPPATTPDDATEP